MHLDFEMFICPNVSKEALVGDPQIDILSLELGMNLEQ